MHVFLVQMQQQTAVQLWQTTVYQNFTISTCKQDGNWHWKASVKGCSSNRQQSAAESSKQEVQYVAVFMMDVSAGSSLQYLWHCSLGNWRAQNQPTQRQEGQLCNNRVHVVNNQAWLTDRLMGHFWDVPQANLLAWYEKTKPNTTKAHIQQSKEMYNNTK